MDEKVSCELKTADTFSEGHKRQILTYLFLLGGRYGKLVNYFPSSVQYQTVNAVLTPEKQRHFTLLKARFDKSTDRATYLVEILQALLEDWGAFLSSELYMEALVHFLGGPSQVWRSLPLKRKALDLGPQKFAVIEPGTALRLTAVSSKEESIEPHLQRLLRLSPLTRLHWINFNHHQVELATLAR